MYFTCYSIHYSQIGIHISVLFDQNLNFHFLSSTVTTTNVHVSDTELHITRGPCGRDRMVVGFTTTCAINAYHL